MQQLTDFAWPPGSVVYQIYPRSFYDSNGDGIGDLKGITEKLGYLNDGTGESLGVDAIWLSPFYTSPMADFGYDVKDYCDVDPIFGTLDDFKELLDEAHEHGIKVMIDFVPNHTSEEHPWFQESRSSKDNPKRDWYVWRSGKPDGSEPNNWQGVFGGSAWQLDEATGEYYLHSFLQEQPDLNWENPAVREAMKDAIAFWLDMGVDGLRLDAVSWMAKDPQLRDNPRNPNYREGIDDPYSALIIRYSREAPELFDYLNEISELAKKYPGRFVVTEAYAENRHDVGAYLQFYDKGMPDISAPFNFECIKLPWKASELKSFIDAFQSVLAPNYMPVYVLGNHDRERVVSRIGPESARMAATMLLTLPGLPFIYSGEELGMENVPIPPEKVQDPFEKNVPGMGLGRDPSRTPMQWSPEPFAGFSNAEPWLPVASDYRMCNVETEGADPRSFLSLYKRLIHLRHSLSALKQGTYLPLELNHPDAFGFIRQYDDQRLAVLLNFSDKEIRLQPELQGTGSLLVTTKAEAEEHEDFQNLTLSPYEGRIIALESAKNTQQSVRPIKKTD